MRLVPNQPAWVFLGLSNTQWRLLPLPLPLGVLGMPTCDLLVSGEALLPLLNQNNDTAVEIAQTELSQFRSEFYNHHRQGMAMKIGFETSSDETDALISDLFALMADERQDFTMTFTRLSGSLKAGTLTDLPNTFEPWFSSWLAYISIDIFPRP